MRVSDLATGLRHWLRASWRLLAAIAVLAGALAAEHAFFGSSGWQAARLPTVQAAALPGTASLSGTVESSGPFKAAQVYIRNVDKRMLYMVFTNAGQFRAVSLFPGNYEVNVVSNDLESEVQKLILKAGDNPRLKLSLRAPAAGAALETAREAQAYDEIYPPGPGRDVAERTCMVCHGENFLPSRPASEAAWNARIDLMMGTTLGEKPASGTPKAFFNTATPREDFR